MGKECFPAFVLLLDSLDEWVMEERKLPVMPVLKERNRRRKSGNIYVFLKDVKLNKIQDSFSS